ncbi:MAG: radical SAM protein [Bacteroidetes bacterium]|nr:radical SAM protein [Bacteroidota bacterium]MCL2301663.1 radical SAM protein [Lentimicrobiaceae bacterium]
MLQKTHYYTIPIFIPEKACPFRCIYCNQYTIANKVQSPSVDEVKETIEKYLKTFPEHGVKKIGFFGGSFTGMSIEEQNQYLNIISPYIKLDQIDSITLSTRPDYVTEEILENLKNYKIETIELGAQSLDNEVLAKSGRGHSVADVKNAAALILQKGFKLGLQMMIGLPGDSFEKTMETAQGIIDLGAHYTRIYPTLVIKDTPLETMYKSRKYTPFSLEQAVEWCKHLMKLFAKNNVTILRMSLHPSEGIITGKNLVAGPFHISFKELVLSALWKDTLDEKLTGKHGEKLVIEVSSKSMNAAIGYQSSNKKYLLEKFRSVSFKINNNLIDNEFNICIADAHYSR